jgi:hypothetical protein
MSLQKKIIKQSTQTTLDMRSGEILEVVDRKEYKVDREPDYIKLYLDDLAYLMHLPNNDVLFCLLKKMNYEGEVILIKSVVEDICQKVNLKNRTYFYSLIKKYTDKDILIKKDRGVYLFNPFFFGRGKWEDIQKIRMSINYTPKDGRQINIETTEMPESLVNSLTA